MRFSLILNIRILESTSRLLQFSILTRLKHSGFCCFVSLKPVLMLSRELAAAAVAVSELPLRTVTLTELALKDTYPDQHLGFKHHQVPVADRCVPTPQCLTHSLLLLGKMTLTDSSVPVLCWESQLLGGRMQAARTSAAASGPRDSSLGIGPFAGRKPARWRWHHRN